MPRPFDRRGNGSVVGNDVVSAYGRRFLINEALEASSPAPLTIVTNWTCGVILQAGDERGYTRVDSLIELV